MLLKVRCLGPRVTKADLAKLGVMVETDLDAQKYLFSMGISYFKGCGKDLREEQSQFLDKPRGVFYHYTCSACGASHEVKFPEVS